MALSKPARLKLIDKLGDALATKSYVSIDAALEAFGAPTSNSWDGPKEDYVVFHLKGVSDDVLMSLADYAGLPEAQTAPATAAKKKARTFKPFRLFISHISAKKDVASTLSTELAQYGIDGFVAHEDISPSIEWRVEVEKRLGTCDALLALLHTGFKESDWTDQEIGWVLGRHKPAFSIKYDLAPYGFFGKAQAFTGNNKTPHALGRELFQKLAAHAETREAISHCLVGHFADSGSFAAGNSRVALLPMLSYWDDTLRNKVEAAAKDNYELKNAFDVAPGIASLKSTWGAPGTVIP
jgi:hypothetical protein